MYKFHSAVLKPKKVRDDVRMALFFENQKKTSFFYIFFFPKKNPDHSWTEFVFFLDMSFFRCQVTLVYISADSFKSIKSQRWIPARGLGSFCLDSMYRVNQSIVDEGNALFHQKCRKKCCITGEIFLNYIKRKEIFRRCQKTCLFR